MGVRRIDRYSVKAKELGYRILGRVLAVTVLFGTIEFSTGTISWLTGKGFTLSLYELEPYDEGVESIYQWHPFTGMTFKPDSVFEGGHPNQKKRTLIFVDQVNLYS